MAPERRPAPKALKMSLSPRLKRPFRLHSSSKMAQEAEEAAAEVVEQAREIMQDKDMLAAGSEFTDRYYASDLSENFINMTDRLFEGTDFKIHLLKLEE